MVTNQLPPQEKYEFRKVAETYEELATVVHNDAPDPTDYILKAGTNKFNFDKTTSDSTNYTIVEVRGTGEYGCNIIPKLTFMKGDMSHGQLYDW